MTVHHGSSARFFAGARSALLACALVVAGAAAAWPQEKPPKDAKDPKDAKVAAADVILVGTQERKVALKDETYKSVDFEGGSESVDRVRVLRYADVPAAYSSGEGLLARRDFLSAALAFGRVADDCKSGQARKLFLQHALYRAGKSLDWRQTLRQSTGRTLTATAFVEGLALPTISEA